MKSIRLHGKFGENAGIVHIRDTIGNSVWMVEFSKEDPSDLTKAKLSWQIK